MWYVLIPVGLIGYPLFDRVLPDKNTHDTQ
jgi:hypothetical protein